MRIKDNSFANGGVFVLEDGPTVAPMMPGAICGLCTDKEESRDAEEERERSKERKNERCTKASKDGSVENRSHIGANERTDEERANADGFKGELDNAMREMDLGGVEPARNRRVQTTLAHWSRTLELLNAQRGPIDGTDGPVAVENFAVADARVVACKNGGWDRKRRVGFRPGRHVAVRSQSYEHNGKGRGVGLQRKRIVKEKEAEKGRIDKCVDDFEQRRKQELN
jgi:hypothetical protein